MSSSNTPTNECVPDLSEYYSLIRYRFVRSVSGSGFLRLSDADRIACRFECGQASNGQIYARCVFRENDYFLLFNHFVKAQGNDNGPNIFGYTTSEQEIELRNLTLTSLDLSSRSEPAPSTCCRATFFVKKFSIFATKEAPVSELKFYLTNFLFMEPPLRWALDTYHATVKRVENYDSVVRAIEAVNGIDVTAELTIETSKLQIPHIDEVKSLVGDLCWLLSLARGCMVQWLWYDAYSSTGQLTQSYHWTPKVTPFSPLEIIPEKPREDTVEFVNQTFGKFRERVPVGKIGRICKKKRKDVWKLDEAIWHFVDALMQESVLELRALKLVTLMEFIVGRYNWLYNLGFYFEPNIFKKRESNLKAKIRDLIRDKFNKDDSASYIDGMVSHTGVLNRHSFSKSVRDLLRMLQIEPKYKEVREFVLIRNSLVHNARFLKRCEEGNTRNKRQQYHYVVGFVSRVLLALLQYDGYFYDWSKHLGPGWAGSGAKARTKISYKAARSNG